MSSNLTNGQEAEVSVAHRTCHSWLSSNVIWAPSLHNIPVKMKKHKKERERGRSDDVMRHEEIKYTGEDNGRLDRMEYEWLSDLSLNILNNVFY